MNVDAAWGRIDEAATDVGRLRRRFDADTWEAHVLGRIAGALEDLDCILTLSAGELVAIGCSVDEALAAMDSHRDGFRRRLGENVDQEIRLARVAHAERARIARQVTS